VDGVDGLVYEHSTAVQGPGSPPGGGVVIGLAAPPGDNGAARGDVAQTAGAPCLENDLAGRVEAVLADHRDTLTRGPLRSSYSVGGFKGDIQRFFHDHVLAR